LLASLLYVTNIPMKCGINNVFYYGLTGFIWHKPHVLLARVNNFLLSMSFHLVTYPIFVWGDYI